jgi:hypothetical protein
VFPRADSTCLWPPLWVEILVFDETFDAGVNGECPNGKLMIYGDKKHTPYSDLNNSIVDRWVPRLLTIYIYNHI